MYWPDTNTGVDIEPARKPVASAVRKFFTEGGLGQAPTIPGGDWFNQITNELLNVLAAAGIDPSKADDDQLLQAIQTVSNAEGAYEALRRSFAEAGYSLRPKPESFGNGGTLTSAADVLLDITTGKAYSHSGPYPHTVEKGTSPTGPGFTDRSGAILRAAITALSGVLVANADWSDIPAHSDPLLGGANGVLNAQAKALAARTEQLRIEKLHTVSGYAGLRAYTGTALVVFVAGGFTTTAKPEGITGDFILDPADTTSADNGGTVLVDALGRRWKRHYDNGLSVGWFGAKGDWDGTTGTDDTDAIQATLVAAYQAAPQTGTRKFSIKVRVPRGRYLIAKSNTLFAGLSNGSFNIEGEGKHGISELVYGKANPTSTDFMLNDVDLFGFTTFTHIKFSASNAANYNFMYAKCTVGAVQQFQFENCSLEGWNNLFKVEGTVMCSEFTFIACRITGFTGVGYSFKNTQGVNWRFYATEIESFSGVLFDYIYGTEVTFYQGSIITTAATARIVRVPVEADNNQFGGGNKPNLVCYGVRFELRAGSLLVEKLQQAVGLALVFAQCGMGGYNLPAGTKPIKWAGAGSIEFNGCDNMAGYCIDNTYYGNNNHDLAIRIRNTPLYPSFMTESVFVDAQATPNVGKSPTFDVQGCGFAFDGVYHPKDSQFATMTMAVMDHPVSWSSNANAMFVGIASGASFTLQIPPKRIKGISLYPISTGAFGSATSTVLAEVVDEGGVTVATIGSFTWPMLNPQVKYELDANVFVDAIAGQKIKLTYTNTYGNQSVSVAYRGTFNLKY